MECTITVFGALDPKAAVGYHWGMKTSYIFGAILACSVIGTFVGARAAKTVLLVLSGALSLYGLARLLG